ncbi:Coiled-coil domain-containing protein 93 [Chamberlinius hualienensis]
MYQDQVEVREDEEQAIKAQEVFDLFVAAGYFRARIKGLSAFDKVVGGMTWCIEVCNVDIDVDLLFHENSTIGQKIALTEKIVAILPKLNCPHRLEPHQIQGLDFVHIFPVIQWLVKRAIEVREETGDYIRAYSVSQFNKIYKMPQDRANDELNSKASVSIRSLLDVYRPKRKYRRHDGHKLPSEQLQVQSTLLEYGKNLSVSNMNASEKGSQSTQPSQDGQKANHEAELKQMTAAMSGMSVTEMNERLPASAVGEIVGLRSEEIRQIASEYADKSIAIARDINEGKLGESKNHKRVVAALQRQILQQQKVLEETQDQHRIIQEQHGELYQQLQQSKDVIESMEKQMKSFENVENEANQDVLSKLRSLVAMNENLKQQEQEFRSHCKDEMARLQGEIEKLKSTHAEDDHEDQERNQLIEKHYQADKEKLQKLRLLLAKKNREIAVLQRKLDEIPTRAELSQYQQRFLELYSQVAAKHKETKQFYTLYNTLDDTKLYLSKEVNLLNSITDNFTQAMTSPNTKQQFLKQFEGIVEGITQNKLKLEKRKQEVKMERDQLNDAYLDLIEKQRIYFKTVKDFKEECRKNELLLSKLKGHRQGNL